jgi:hypothetical protein
MLQAKEHALIPWPFVIFTFELVVECIQKFGGASLGLGGLGVIIVLELIGLVLKNLETLPIGSIVVSHVSSSYNV